MNTQELLKILNKTKLITKINGEDIVFELRNSEEFKDGDILYNHKLNTISILKGDFNDGMFTNYCYVSLSDGHRVYRDEYKWSENNSKCWVKADKNQEKILYNALKGYELKWNPELKILEDDLFEPKDKELAWCWNDEDLMQSCMIFDEINYATFDSNGKRGGTEYENYERFEGEYPEWYEYALSKLED